MPRNGSGTYTAPPSTWNPGVNGVTATTADYNAQLTDVSAAITQSVSRDGQSPMTGNLPMGNNKITGLASGTANTDAVNLSQVNSNAGQCRLIFSAGNLVLMPFQGNRLTINGVVYTVPSGGITLTSTGTVATTLYYIYAYMVGATMTLEYSTTGHSTDATTGMEIKTGDATRTLVGMARPAAGPVWVSNISSRLVISWFNRRDLTALAVFQADRTTTSLTLTEINTEIRNEVLTWGDSSVAFSVSGAVGNGTNAGATYTSVAVDSTTVQIEASSMVFNPATATILAAIGIQGYNVASEGYHFYTVLGRSVGGGTSTWKGGATTGERTSLQTKTSG